MMMRCGRGRTANGDPKLNKRGHRDFPAPAGISRAIHTEREGLPTFLPALASLLPVSREDTLLRPGQNDSHSGLLVVIARCPYLPLVSHLGRAS